jgi:glutathione S-transferase
MANRLGCVGEEMENIKAYVAKIQARPAFIKAIEME